MMLPKHESRMQPTAIECKLIAGMPILPMGVYSKYRFFYIKKVRSSPYCCAALPDPHLAMIYTYRALYIDMKK